MNAWTEKIDLASARLGGVVVAANDDFFAEKENLVKDEAPVWVADRYTDRGKWMDGWETRRRRTPGHDWAIVRLGMPGIVRGVVVDTAFFRGNYPEACWIEGAVAPHDASEERLLSGHTAWIEVLPRVPLSGDAKNAFAVRVPWRFTHLKLHIDPDGGVARLRVHGDVVPEPGTVAGANAVEAPFVDLAALEHGGRVIAASDMFFGSRHNLILPGESRGMFDGWETRRRRGPGHDWVIVRLGARGTIERVVVDTSHFKGNAPGSCRLDVADVPDPTIPDEAISGMELAWRPLVDEQALRAHDVHTFTDVVRDAGPATHVRLRIDPDGGVARLRLFGHVDPSGRRRLALARLDALLPAEAEAEFLRCLGAPRWAHALASARPFAEEKALFAAAEKAADALGEADWQQAFAAHPRIGGAAKGWASDEQKGASAADPETRRRLDAGNRAYEEKFGRIFLIRATGRSAAEMLEALESRLDNDARSEFAVAVREQREITRLRLEKLLST